MKKLALLTALVIGTAVTACDVQSGITKKGLEKFEPSPTPKINVPTPVPIDPAEVVNVDVNAGGPNININKPEQKKTFNCDKFNRLIVNADEKDITVEGACRQVMINGDKNKIKVAAVAEVVVNGSDNTVEHWKYANGQHPIVTDNGGSSTISKTTAPEPEKKAAK